MRHMGKSIEGLYPGTSCKWLGADTANYFEWNIHGRVFRGNYYDGYDNACIDFVETSFEDSVSFGQLVSEINSSASHFNTIYLGDRDPVFNYYNQYPLLDEEYVYRFLRNLPHRVVGYVTDYEKLCLGSYEEWWVIIGWSSFYGTCMIFYRQ